MKFLYKRLIKNTTFNEKNSEINPNVLEAVVCEKCSNPTFQLAFVFHKNSKGIQSKRETYICSKCGLVSEQLTSK